MEEHTHNDTGPQPFHLLFLQQSFMVKKEVFEWIRTGQKTFGFGFGISLKLNAIRMKEPVVISFIHLPKSSREDLQFLERKLKEEARISGIELLNKR
jgi:hypothetical protein